MQCVLKEVEVASEKVSQQMESICQEYEWLGKVWEFSRMWREGQWDVWEFIREWSNSQRGVASPEEEEEEYNNIRLADEFEVTLNQLYKWRNQFVALPPEILTPYAMLCISSCSLVDMFCSALDVIRDEIKSAAIKRSRLLCEKVLEETKQRAEVGKSNKIYRQNYFSFFRCSLPSDMTWRDLRSLHTTFERATLFSPGSMTTSRLCSRFTASSSAKASRSLCKTR